MIGYQDFVAVVKSLFVSAEYRIPFLPSLNAEILGLVSLGRTSLALFTDIGVVYNGISESGLAGDISRWGSGAELKNRITFIGLDFVHSIGVAQLTNQLFGENDTEVYYRIKTVVPF